MRFICLWLCGACCLLQAQAPLYRAYDLLRDRQYEPAIEAFRQSLSENPSSVSTHKDLAYTFLKIGETESARDEFAEAMRLAPGDYHVALEYAFLCHETKQIAEARRVFDRVRKAGDPASRVTAERAFENVDRPLREGIARWQEALRVTAGTFSAHKELAELAEQRDELPLALDQYGKAWALRPDQRALLVSMARVARALGQQELAAAYLIAASRGAEPHAAETALGLLGRRYPYVYEFRKAIEIDPSNAGLRRELAFLYLEMKQTKDAEREFAKLVELAPDDILAAAQLGLLRLAREDTEGAMPLLNRALDGPDEELADRVRTALRLPQTLRQRPEASRRKVSEEAKSLAERSLQAGYLKDAVKYLSVAHESDPLDFSVMLKLGWANNVLKDDATAIRWFRLASRSPDTVIAGEASRAFHNLAPQFSRVRTTSWIFPLFSSRWHDLFGYGQVKTEFRIKRLHIRPYLSVRFVGDLRGTAGGTESIAPQYLSESSTIFGAGIATEQRHGLMAWGEAGLAVSYLGRRPDSGLAKGDYRGGVAFAKGFGRLLGAESGGVFFETNEDTVFVSRFQNDVLFYSQNRLGWTFAPLETGGSLQLQLYWNQNLTADRNRQYWANYWESGPGLKFRFAAMPPSMFFTVNMLRGIHIVNEGNPRSRTFSDVRAGFWYAR